MGVRGTRYHCHGYKAADGAFREQYCLQAREREIAKRQRCGLFGSFWRIYMGRWEFLAFIARQHAQRSVVMAELSGSESFTS